MENGRVCPRGPTKNHQNHQHKQKQPKPPKPNLMEIKGNGKGYPREAVGDLMGLKGNWERVPQGSLCVSLFV